MIPEWEDVCKEVEDDLERLRAYRNAERTRMEVEALNRKLDRLIEIETKIKQECEYINAPRKREHERAEFLAKVHELQRGNWGIFGSGLFPYKHYGEDS